jgi:menaquinone-dependent protoporphyrinogen oxidase
MVPVLVLYATTDGHTRKIAHVIGDTLRSCGARVDVIEAGHGEVPPEAYAGIVVAASLHGGGYQRAVKDWIRAHSQSLDARPTAFVSVCLGVLQESPKVQRHLADIIERFCAETAWRPTVTKIVAGALLYTRYWWLKRWVMKRIAGKAGGGIDTSRDYEYTDWTDLSAFAEEFAGRVPPEYETRKSLKGLRACPDRPPRQ